MKASLAVLALSLAVACSSSGQTGSPICPGASTCACQALWRRDVFRGHIVGSKDAMIEVELEELYSPARSPLLVPGARGTFRYSLGPTSCVEPGTIPEPRVDDVVLVALDPDAGEMWLVPWSDPLDLGDRQVPVATLAESANHRTCDADLEQPPCNDLVEGSACSTGKRRGEVTGVWAIVALVATLMGRWRRSRRAASRQASAPCRPASP